MRSDKSVSDVAALADALRAIVGADHVDDREAKRRLHSEDIWQVSDAVVPLIVSPQSTAELCDVMAAVHRAGFDVAPRGAGMSYTGGYIPAGDNVISLDLSGMNRILRISRDDMTVTVEAGVTWKQLYEALSAQGLRTPFWGPMSGLTSTVGGGLSQLNAVFGAGQYGTTSESVVGVSVVLADGKMICTAARGPEGFPFFRHYGPDLTGLFCGDCGAFGVKAEITLRLISLPAHEDYASFSFPTGEDLLRGMAELSRAGVTSEMCAFDPGLTAVRLARASITSDVKTLGAVVAKEKTLAKGLLAAARVAVKGRKIVAEDEYPLHVICEGRSQAGVAFDMSEVRRIAAEFNGVEIESTIARVIRATPFPALNSMLGPDGEAWVPIHGVLPLSAAPAAFDAIKRIYTDMAAEHEAAGVKTGFLFTALSTNAIIVEPVFFWPAGWRPIHESAVEPAHVARLTRREPNDEARAVVVETRRRVLEALTQHGASHFQIGRTYPYRQSRDDVSRALLDAIKDVVDPERAINAGVLGFDGRRGA